MNGGTSGLIILPPGATPTSASTGVASGYAAATGTVTAGQTVGFQWRLFTDIPSLAAGTYTLSCFMVDAATQSIPTPFATGVSCQVPATIVSPNAPAIYIATQGNLTGSNHTPAWGKVSGVMFATLLVPLLLFRRRLAYPKQLVLLALLLLAGAASLTGCGSGSTGSAVVTPSGTYYFRVSATMTSGGTKTVVTSTAFSVKVTGGS